MKSWHDFSIEEPELAQIGQALLFRSRIGLAFLATLRKDGAPRLHPVSLIISNGHLYVLIPASSPKCADLVRDGRYAMQAFPSQGEENEEFYLAGRAERIQATMDRQAVIKHTNILAGEDEVMFEILLDRAMYTKLVDYGTPDERPVHRKWRSVGS